MLIPSRGLETPLFFSVRCGCQWPEGSACSICCPVCINALTLGTRFPRSFVGLLGADLWDYSMPVVTRRKHFGTMPIWLTAASTAFGIGTVRGVLSQSRVGDPCLFLEASLVGGPQGFTFSPMSLLRLTLPCRSTASIPFTSQLVSTKQHN